MSLYLKIILIIFGVAYLISPVDLIPDLLLPFVGWIDDGVVIATIVYLIRYGRLPYFLFKKQRPFTQSFDKKTANFGSGKKNQDNTGPTTQASPRQVPKTPCEILGLGPNASKNEIQAAYKQAIKKYHPDKLSHLGEEFSDLANEKFLEIQKAYDELMKEH